MHVTILLDPIRQACLIQSLHLFKPSFNNDSINHLDLGIYGPVVPEPSSAPAPGPGTTGPVPVPGVTYRQCLCRMAALQLKNGLSLLKSSLTP